MDNTSDRSESPDDLNGEYYYMKALSYLAVSTEGSAEQGRCRCLHCPPSEDDKMDDDHFSTGFRPGLTLDDLHGCHASSETSSQYSVSPPTSSGHLQEHKSGSARWKSLQAGGSGDSSRKPTIKRKLSDGHVHWADEFQKDLARCRPRKVYTRHPSLQATHLKPILKVNPEEGDQND